MPAGLLRQAGSDDLLCLIDCFFEESLLFDILEALLQRDLFQFLALCVMCALHHGVNLEP